jgi:hypothetical protein
MKKLYHLYNENFEITHAEFFIDGEHPENAVFVEGVNFMKPMFNPETNEVFEGATTEEIEQLNNQLSEQMFADINDIYAKMHKSVLERVTGKRGNIEFLNSLQIEYEQKYKVALKVLADEPTSYAMYDAIDREKEFEDFAGDTLYMYLAALGLNPLNDRMKDFCQLIKYKYEYGNELYSNLMAMLSQMRTRLIVDVEKKQFDKYNQRKEIVCSIDNNDTILDIQTKYSNFMAL